MKRSTAILKVKDIMDCLKKGLCDRETAACLVIKVSSESGLSADELIKDATVFMVAEIELNTFQL